MLRRPSSLEYRKRTPPPDSGYAEVDPDLWRVLGKGSPKRTEPATSRPSGPRRTMLGGPSRRERPRGTAPGLHGSGCGKSKGRFAVGDTPHRTGHRATRREALMRKTVRFQGVALWPQARDGAQCNPDRRPAIARRHKARCTRETPNNNSRTTATSAAIRPRPSPPVQLPERLVDRGGVAPRVPAEDARASAQASSALPQTGRS